MTISPASFGSGSQEPRFRVAPPRTSGYGDLAGEFSSAYRLTPDPWQQTILDDWLGLDDGRWSSLKCGLSVPRQNGKNGALEIRELFGAVGLGEKILHTAHQVKTAQKHFRRLKHFFGRKVADPAAEFPELNKLVVELRNVNGQEAIYLANGASIEIVARSTGSGRGFTVDVIVCDEAQDMSDEDLEALLSTSSAAPSGNPQWIFTGTPPGPRVNGEVFTRLRNDALGGTGDRTAWHEWSMKPGTDLDDRAAWVEVNPGLITGRLQWAVVEGERSTYSDEGFGRERGGMWEEASTTAVIDPASWAWCEDTESIPLSRFVLAVDANPERTVASVALAGVRADGLTHVELDESRAGLGWIPGYLQERCRGNPIATVVIDKRSPAATLVDELRRRKIRLQLTEWDDMAKACGGFYDAVMDGQLRHIGQPQMSAAVASARKRDLGERWAWNRKNASADITPLVSATLAHWGVQATKVKTRGSTTERRAVLL